MSRPIVLLVLMAMVTGACGSSGSGDPEAGQKSTVAIPSSILEPSTTTTIRVAPSTTTTATSTTTSVRTTSTVDGEDLGVIAYNRDGELWLMFGDGSGAHALVTSVLMEGAPAWSPDGTRIAFSGFEPGPEVVTPDIWVVNSDGTGLVNLTHSPGPSMLWPSWSPDGTRIVFADTGSRDLWIIEIDKGDSVRITFDSAHQSSPAWAPDGSLIAYCVLPVVDNVFGRNDIWVANPDGSNTRMLTDMGDTCSPSWSPDSRELAFTVFVFSEEPGSDQSDVWIMNRDGTGQRNLTNDPTRFDRNPSWSLDGTKIAFDSAGPIVGRDDPDLGLVIEHDPPADVYIMNVNGGPKTRLTTGNEADGAPAWRPQ